MAGFIKLSPVFVNTSNTWFLHQGLTGSGTTQSVSYRFANAPMLDQLSGGGSTVISSRFCIMQGTVPTDFTTLTTFNARSADLLITYTPDPQITPNLSNQFLPTVQAATPMVLATSYVDATATGTATWFWWMTCPCRIFNYRLQFPTEWTF